MGYREADWMKLDLDWYRDEKIRRFENKYGSKYTGNILKVFAVCRSLDREDYPAIINTNDEVDMDLLVEALKISKKSAFNLLEKMATFHLIKPEPFFNLGLVGNDRISHDLEKWRAHEAHQEDLSRKRSEAGKKGVEAKRAKAIAAEDSQAIAAEDS